VSGAAPAPSSAIVHGVLQLTAVTVDAYNAELRDGNGFVGDRASNGAFRAMIDGWRDRLREVGDDPLGTKPTDELSKKKLDRLLVEGHPEAAGVIHGAIEEFATELAVVTTRFLGTKGWRNVERIVVGGGLRASRIGELAIGRASVMLKVGARGVELTPIHNHPDEAGLIGAVHLVPAWMLAGHDAILAVDVGASNLRAGIIELRLKKAPDFAESAVHEMELWRYADDDPKPSRDAAVNRLGEMLRHLVRRAGKHDLTLAPFVGIACPGVIAEDSAIERGGQNLPGNWESRRFNLPAAIRKELPTIGDHDTTVVMHNDAVVQGLSEVPFMHGVAHWGVLTIGTGLGNASFTNRENGA
jgi:hypothetical protein